MPEIHSHCLLCDLHWGHSAPISLHFQGVELSDGTIRLSSTSTDDGCPYQVVSSNNQVLYDSQRQLILGPSS